MKQREEKTISLRLFPSSCQRLIRSPLLYHCSMIILNYREKVACKLLFTTHYVQQRPYGHHTCRNFQSSFLSCLRSFFLSLLSSLFFYYLGCYVPSILYLLPVPLASALGVYCDSFFFCDSPVVCQIPPRPQHQRRTFPKDGLRQRNITSAGSIVGAHRCPDRLPSSHFNGS